MSSSDNPPTPQCTVADLRKGQKISGTILLVEAANFKQTRNQKYFIQMSLRDRTGAIRAVLWEATEEIYNSFGTDDFVRVDGRVEEFQGLPQLVIDQLERQHPDNVDYANFLPVSERDIAEMETELRQAIGEIRRTELKELLLNLVNDPEIHPGLLRCPAGKALHHACVGGLLEHICSLLGAARQISHHYPQLDRDLLYAGAILHDIGKIEELSYSGNFQYTDLGQLVGHIGIGLNMVQRIADEIPDFPRDLLLEIQHIIASHHGLPEHGALKLPMTAEAIAFHFLDNLDARLSMLETIEKELPNSELTPRGAPRWSDFKPHMDRKIYFPRPLSNT